MAEKRMTKKDWFETVMEIVLKSDVDEDTKKEACEFLAHEVALLTRVRSGMKQTSTKAAHEETMATIMKVLKDAGKPMTITDMLDDSRLEFFIIKTDKEEKKERMTNQRLTAIVKKLESANQIVRTEIKKRAYFSLPKTEDDTEEA